MVHLKRSTTIVVTIIPHIETSGVIVHNSYYSSFKHIKIIVHKTLVPNFGIRDAHEARKWKKSNLQLIHKISKPFHSVQTEFITSMLSLYQSETDIHK